MAKLKTGKNRGGPELEEFSPDVRVRVEPAVDLKVDKALNLKAAPENATDFNLIEEIVG